MRIAVVTSLVSLEALVLVVAASSSATAAKSGFYEAKSLEPAASFVAGKPAVVFCAESNRTWNEFLTVTGDAGRVAAGSTVPGSGDEKLYPLACRTLLGHLEGKPQRPAFLALSILTLVHEAFHMRGAWNEGETDCDAFRAMPRVAVEFFHVRPGAQLRELMAQASDWRGREPLWYRTYC